MDCLRSKKYGLETYNNCLENKKIAALDGKLTEQTVVKNSKTIL